MEIELGIAKEDIPIHTVLVMDRKKVRGLKKETDIPLGVTNRNIKKGTMVTTEHFEARGMFVLPSETVALLDSAIKKQRGF